MKFCHAELLLLSFGFQETLLRAHSPVQAGVGGYLISPLTDFDFDVVVNIDAAVGVDEMQI